MTGKNAGPHPDAFFRRNGSKISFGPAHTPGSTNWRARLITNSHGGLVACEANIMLLIENDPRWSDVLWFNEFSARPMIRRPAPWDICRDQPDRELTDADGTEAAMWMQREFRLMVTPQKAALVMLAAAHNRSYHPVRDYLHSIEWDGTSRIGQWLPKYMGADDTHYNRAVGMRWLIGAVARIFRPGCKLDTALILEGRQGLKKSTAAAVLGGAWFNDHLPDPTTKDALQQLQGIWILELAEMTAFSRTEAARIKSFMSASVDRFRPTYGRFARNFPRQCVFIGTINPEAGYLKDPTGSRRFWIVQCGEEIAIDALRQDRDQIWAEAVHQFKAGEPWWLDSPDLEAEAGDEQDKRYADDARDSEIAAWVEENAIVDDDGCRSVSVSEVLEHALKMLDRSRWTQAEQNVAARCLVSMGWRRRRVGPRRKRDYRYFAPTSS